VTAPLTTGTTDPVSGISRISSADRWGYVWGGLAGEAAPLRVNFRNMAQVVNPAFTSSAAASGAVAVRTQEQTAMSAAVDHLAGLGHERIGYVGRSTADAWAVQRRDAFVHQMARRRLSAAFVEEIAKGDRSALSRLDADLRRATAVIAGSEQLALGVWHVALEAGLRVPRDLSLVGFGELRSEFDLWPRFSSIDQRPEVKGQAAARMAVDADARAALGAARHVDVEPVLLQGETTAPPA
jgi:DNA-binding LacI/PurR family transcriptional regulator